MRRHETLGTEVFFGFHESFAEQSGPDPFVMTRVKGLSSCMSQRATPSPSALAPSGNLPNRSWDGR